MAEPTPGRTDEAQKGGVRDPFAELTRIIGFDPRVKIRTPSTAPEQPEEAVEAAQPAAAPQSQQEPAPALPRDSDRDIDSGPVDAWELDSPPSDFVEREQGLATASSGPESADPLDDLVLSGGSLDEVTPADDPFDEEGWQEALAASLDRITAETTAHHPPVEARSPEPVVAPAETPVKAVEDRELLDAPLQLDQADWDWPEGEELVRVEDELSDEPLPAQEAVLQHAAPAVAITAETESHAADALDLEADLDLDHVLAASIERELEQDLSEDQPEALVPPAAASLADRAEQADVVARPELEAPEPVAVAPVEEPELDFESELAELLAADDEIGSAGPAADDRPALLAPAAAISPDDGKAARDEENVVEAVAPTPEPVAAASEEREASLEPVAASAAHAEPAAEARSDDAAPPEPPAASGEDPFAALAAMAARYRVTSPPKVESPRKASSLRLFPIASSPPRAAPEALPAAAVETPPAETPAETNLEEEAPVETMRSQLPSRDPMPEIETVDVPEHAAALADDLDIPEMPVDRPRGARAPFDDLDTEFAELLQEMTEGRRAAVTPAPVARLRRGEDALRAPAAQEFASPAPRHESHGYAAPPAAETADEDIRADEEHWRALQAEDERDVEEGQSDDVARIEVEEDDDRLRQGKRGFWLGSLLASVVVVGGYGAYAVGSGGIAVSGAPALVKADAGPVKMRPKDPGGAKVPNQDNTVYERVAGAATDAPVQTKLVASAEEPMDLTPPPVQEPIIDGLELSEGEDPIEALVKNEERVAEAPAVETPPPVPAEEGIAIAPRKVRTMMVRADGTLVPREEGVSEEPAALVEPVVDAAQEAIRKAQQGAKSPAPDAAPTGAIPADAQPAPQPKPAAVQVASLEPGAWSMQIASQPSEEGARNAYQDLAGRFGDVLGNRGVNIVKADVEGKGTFWRVRIPTESRNDAVSLCTSFKAAGGSCFVSK